jgi:hypothetical protein
VTTAEPEQPGGQPRLRIEVPLQHAGGVWANWAQITESAHEFTIDFARLDHSQEPIRGVLVARVALSSKLLAELVEALGETWDRYAAQATHEELENVTNEREDSGDDSGAA